MLKTEMIHFASDSSFDLFIEKYKQTAQLPLANMGKIQFENIWNDLGVIKTLFDELTAGFNEEKETIGVELGETFLSGTVQGIYNNQVIAYSFSNAKKKESSRKYILEAWVKHLALVAQGKGKNTHFLWNYEPNKITIPANVITQDEARKILSDLLGLYRNGQKQILPFMPDLSFNLVYGNSTKEKGFKELKAHGIATRYKSFKDKYIEREIEEGYFDQDSVSNPDKMDWLEEAAIKVWQPLSEEGKLFK
jgi:exonuclease V gamma subunit